MIKKAESLISPKCEKNKELFAKLLTGRMKKAKEIDFEFLDFLKKSKYSQKSVV